MFPRLKYTGHSILLHKKLVRYFWSELPNTGIVVTTSCRRSYWRGQNRCCYDRSQLTYLFIPPPVTWFHLWVDMFPSIIGFLCWSIWHMFPECRLSNKELNAFNRIAVQERCVINLAKVVWIGQMIVTHSAGYPRVDGHCGGHFVQPFEYSVGQSKVANGCHGRVPEMRIDGSSAQVGLDAPVR